MIDLQDLKKNYGEITEFVQLETEHERIHEIAMELIELKRSGEDESARRRSSELIAQKDRLLEYVQLLEDRVNQLRSVS